MLSIVGRIPKDSEDELCQWQTKTEILLHEYLNLSLSCKYINAIRCDHNELRSFCPFWSVSLKFDPFSILQQFF
jgi:hypothetical protein